MDKITYGKLGEEKAQQFLKQQGYKILAVNYQLRCGEIDIIAQKGKVIIFAEVKTRISDLYGVPAAAVNLKKQQKIIKVMVTQLTDCSTTPSKVEITVQEKLTYTD